MPIRPARLTPSTRDFYLPPTIQSDFVNYLYTDIPNANYTFEIVHDWYARLDEDYDKVYTRATYFPVNWKSKVGNSDMSSNFKTDFSVPIHKGDYVIKDDGRVYLLSWWVSNYVNCQATQATACNAYITFKRTVDEVLDQYGYLVEPEHEITIADNLPVSISEYASKPEYIVNNGYPGVVPDALVQAVFQCNSVTRNIRINDFFEWGIFTYRVVDINYSEVDVDSVTGNLNIYAKRIAGEIDA